MLLSMFKPIIEKNAKPFEEELVKFFESQPVEQGQKFGFFIFAENQEMYAVPVILDQTNTLTQTSVQFNEQEYKAVKLNTLITQLLTKI